MIYCIHIKSNDYCILLTASKSSKKVCSFLIYGGTSLDSAAKGHQMDKKRKYMTEVGLGISLNHFTLVPANRLSIQEKIDPYKYHLYSIVCGHKVYFDEKETRIITFEGATGLRVVFFSFDEQNNKNTYMLPFLIDVTKDSSFKLDYSKVMVQIIYPNEILIISINDQNYINEYGKDASRITIPAQDLFWANISAFWKR